MTLTDSRIRKLSHSSDEVDPRGSDGSSSGSVARAQSTSDLGPGQMHLPISHSDGTIVAVANSGNESTSGPVLSPLSAFNRDSVLGTFNVLAKGVQSLAPGAGKFARGVQNIGANLDPRKLKSMRQTNFDNDLELNEKIAECKSQIIRL